MKNLAKIKMSLRNFGYEVKKINSSHQVKGNSKKSDFDASSKEIYKLHFEQSIETVETLKLKYNNPVLGEVSILEALKLLSQCVDPTDNVLYCTNQLIHTLQVVDGMEKDGINDSDMLIAALVHDLGKILLLFGEKPENVVCINRVIDQDTGIPGFDNHVFQWNHDEFVYSRLKDYLPYHVSWLIRYHSIRIHECEKFSDEKDKHLLYKYLIPFKKYDQGTKSMYFLPDKKIDDYQDLLNQYFPNKIVI